MFPQRLELSEACSDEREQVLFQALPSAVLRVSDGLANGLLGQARDDRFLGLEVVEERAGSDARGLGNVARPRRFIAVVRKQPTCRLQDALPRGRFGFRCHSHENHSGQGPGAHTCNMTMLIIRSARASRQD